MKLLTNEAEVRPGEERSRMTDEKGAMQQGLPAVAPSTVKDELVVADEDHRPHEDDEDGEQEHERAVCHRCGAHQQEQGEAAASEGEELRAVFIGADPELCHAVVA